MTSLADQWTNQLAGRLEDGSGEPAWLGDVRRSGAAAFKRYGLPHRKVEDWKYTSLKLLEARSHALFEDARAERPSSEVQWPELLVSEDCAVVRMLNGSPQPGLDADGPIDIVPLAQALAGGDRSPWLREVLQSLAIDRPARAFSALNTSMLGEGLVIDVPADSDGGTLMLQWSFDDRPPAMLFNARVVIRLAKGASLTLVEQFESPAAHSHGLNLVSQIQVGEGARLNHLRLQQEADEAALILRSECQVLKDGHYASHAFDWGGGLVRHDTRPSLLQPGAEADVNGAFVLDGSRHLDHHVFVDHAAGPSRSSQFFRGVLGGHSRGVFNGKARIQQGADGSTVRQSNANLLLSTMAEIDTKPELEIYADEVEASHGATVGQLDEEAVFYMRTRGLSDEQARAMLTSAFCKAVLERITDLPVSLVKEIADRMEKALGKLVGAAPSPRPGAESRRGAAPTSTK